MKKLTAGDALRRSIVELAYKDIMLFPNYLLKEELSALKILIDRKLKEVK